MAISNLRLQFSCGISVYACTRERGGKVSVPLAVCANPTRAIVQLRDFCVHVRAGEMFSGFLQKVLEIIAMDSSC